MRHHRWMVCTRFFDRFYVYDTVIMFQRWFFVQITVVHFSVIFSGSVNHNNGKSWKRGSCQTKFYLEIDSIADSFRQIGYAVYVIYCANTKAYSISTYIDINC